VSRRSTTPRPEIRKNRVRQPSFGPIDDAPRSGEVSSHLRRTLVWQDIFFQIEVFSKRVRGYKELQERSQEPESRSQEVRGELAGQCACFRTQRAVGRRPDSARPYVAANLNARYVAEQGGAKAKRRRVSARRDFRPSTRLDPINYCPNAVTDHRPPDSWILAPGSSLIAGVPKL
jgi:hypothetical protein